MRRDDNDSINLRWSASRPRTILAGVVLSSLLHAGLITAIRMPAAPPATIENGPAAPSLFWILPQRPQIPIAERAPEAVRDAGPRPRVAATNRAPRLPSAQAGEPLALAPTQAPTAAPAVSPERKADAAAQQPRLDMDAARKTARKFAGERAGKNDPAVAQLQDKPINEPRTETRLARAIDGATRPDCKTLASNAGLFALIIVPHAILTDKKDSGCKW